ncbi:MAG: hypothetical protein SNJ57_03840 [Cyanobacteriota bacterium]
MARRPQYLPDFDQMELLWNLKADAERDDSNGWIELDIDLPEDPVLLQNLELEAMKLEEMELDLTEEWTTETADAWIEETRQLFEHEGSDEALYERVVQAIYVLCDRIRREDAEL